MKTFDEIADEYIKNAILSEGAYKGDVHTAFVCGMMEYEKYHKLQIESIEKRLSEVEKRTSGDIVVGGPLS